MRARETEKILLKDGWYFVKQVGSHRQYKHPTKPGKVTIPFHSGDLDKGTAESILKQAGLKQPSWISNKERGVDMKLVYPAIFTPCKEKEGYTVVVPDLPGCVTEGSSLADAIDMGVDAASGWILGELEDGNDIPAASEYKDIAPDTADSFVNLLVLDMESYAEKYGSKAVRKNITIPAWLNAYGEKNHLNFSKILQDALLSMTQKASNQLYRCN